MFMPSAIGTTGRAGEALSVGTSGRWRVCGCGERSCSSESCFTLPTQNDGMARLFYFFI